MRSKIKNSLSIALAMSFIPLSGMTASATIAPTALTPSVDCGNMFTNIYHSINPTSNTSLISTSSSEISNAALKYGYTDNRGASFKASSTAKEGLVPVYRLFKNGDFMYVPDGEGVGEYETATQNGYVNEGVNFYAYMAKPACGIPVYRLVKGDKHIYATMENDKLALTRAGWTDEGVKFWANESSTAIPGPAPLPLNPPRTKIEPPVTAPNDADKVFSIAVIPDTQQEVGTDTRFAQRNHWLISNRESLDLRYVLHTGDMVNWDTPTHNQYVVASNAMKVLDDAKMPVSVAIGNHDTNAVGEGGSARPGTNASVEVRNTTTFNNYFNATRYSNVEGAFEPGKIDNTYSTFRAGGKDWMVLSLELWPRTEAVNWAKGVVAAHPNHNVIVNTHAYMNADGTISTSNGGYGANSPKYLFDNLVKVYPNIKMVFSGHVGSAAAREDVGTNGNRIFSYLGTFHSNETNPVRVLEIDTEKGTLSNKIMAPSLNQTWTQYSKVSTGLTLK